MAITSTQPDLQSARPATQGVPGLTNNLLLPAEGPAGGPARRLVVLVPDCDVDEASLAGRIWSLAAPRELDILFVGTVRRAPEEFRARRRLARIAAITRDDHLRVDSTLAFGADWLEAARSLHRPGDLVVCPAELPAAHGLRRRPLAGALLASLKAPIYVFAGFYPNLPSERTPWVTRLAVWCPPLTILLGFFVLQARLLQSGGGWAPSALFYLSVVAEFVLILAWERFLGTLP